MLSGTCAVWPGSGRKGPSFKKWDSEVRGHIRIYLPTKRQPCHEHMRQGLQGDLIGLEIEK